jgi:hypothetical protein
MCHGQLITLGYRFIVLSFPYVAELPHHIPYTPGICHCVVFVQPMSSTSLYGEPEEFGKQLQASHIAQRCLAL